MQEASLLYSAFRGLTGVHFRMDDLAQKTLNPESVKHLSRQLQEYLQWYEYWGDVVRYYTNWDIQKKLDEDESGWKEDVESEKEYHLGGDYATLGNISDNLLAATLLKEQYEARYGTTHSLAFDPEYSYCFVYATDRKDAEQFLAFINETIILPVLHDIKQQG